MPVAKSVEALLEELHQALQATAWVESELAPDDIQEILAVFCRHRRLLRILLTLCEED